MQPSEVIVLGGRKDYFPSITVNILPSGGPAVHTVFMSVMNGKLVIEMV